MYSRIIASTSNRQIFSLIAILAVVAVGIALTTQHVLGMHPCVWCVFQRLVCILIAFSALIGVIFTNRPMQAMSALLVVGWSIVGVSAAVAQRQAVLAQDSCALSIADKVMTWTGLDVSIPAVFEPQATCVDAAADLFGVPYEIWTLLLFVFLGLLALVALFKPKPQSKYFY